MKGVHNWRKIAVYCFIGSDEAHATCLAWMRSWICARRKRISFLHKAMTYILRHILASKRAIFEVKLEEDRKVWSCYPPVVWYYCYVPECSGISFENTTKLSKEREYRVCRLWRTFECYVVAVTEL